MEHTRDEIEYVANCLNSIDLVSKEDESVVVACIINDESDLTPSDFAHARHFVLCWNEYDKTKQQRDELLVAVKKIYDIEECQRETSSISALRIPPLPKSEIQQIAKQAIAKAVKGVEK